MILSGILYDACGALPSVRIIFDADRTTLNGVIRASRCEFVTQEDGSYSIDLEAGYYRVSWLKEGRAIYLGMIVADADGEMTLPQALGADFSPISPEAADDILEQMRVEADRAELAEATAVAAETTAVAAADSAEADAGTAESDRVIVQGLATQVTSDAADAVAAKNGAEAARDQAVAIADPEEQIEAAFDIWIVDKERAAFEAATGGACTIERSAGGQACHMFILPKTTWSDLVPSGELGTGTHEAFIEDGVEKSELLIGMYLASSRNGELVSQPKRVPRRSINWDNSVADAQAAGLTLMSNWEWSAIAFWCMANGFQPRGNTASGKSHSHPHEQGINVEYSNTETGSGPAAWRHNNAAQGIADLVGNVWEWQWGFKMVDGRILLAPDNDKSLVESAWVDTGYDLPSDANPWSSLTQVGATQQVQRALIVPNGVADPDGRLYANLAGERFPYRGGSRGDGGIAGLGALFLNFERTISYNFIGLRLSRLV